MQHTTKKKDIIVPKKLIRFFKSNHFLGSTFWFSIGFILTTIFLGGFILIFLENLYKDKVYEGVFIENLYVGGKTKGEIESLFDNKNLIIKRGAFSLLYNDQATYISARDLNIGYDSKLISEQAFSLGRSNDLLTNFYIIVNSYINGVMLNSSYTYSQDQLKSKLSHIQKEIFIEPEDALFTVENNKVIAFKQSVEGKTIDYVLLNKIINEKILDMIKNTTEKTYTIKIPIEKLEPKITTEKANTFGIVELIGEGVSNFQGSDANRLHNINISTSKLNGILVEPDEIFSFIQSLGEITKETGFKEGLVIKNGKLVPEDGGGVCQVSTTLFRAILNAGLPIIERQAHLYRVSYYEQGFPPGLDATVYSPNPDLKFKNDFNHHILIKADLDLANYSLSFKLYGKKDGRETILTKPKIIKTIPPPSPLYKDDPNLAKGEVKQIQKPGPGATVVFDREVTKNGKIIISETFTSNYLPWQETYLRGTRE